MFTGIGDSLTKVFKKLTGTRFLEKGQIDDALKDVRMALIEADVSISVISDISDFVKNRILGQEVIKSIAPNQMVVKAVYDAMITILGGEIENEDEEDNDKNKSIKVFLDKLEKNPNAIDENNDEMGDFDDLDDGINHRNKKKSKSDKKQSQNDALRKLNANLMKYKGSASINNNDNIPDKSISCENNNIEKPLYSQSNDDERIENRASSNRSKSREKNVDRIPNLNIHSSPGKPAIIMMVGLQGAGKTTTCAKLALHLRKKYKKSPLLVSLDVHRPAAQLQLESLAKQVAIESLPICETDKDPLEIAKKALKYAPSVHADLIIFDTAGRLNIDEELMAELSNLKNLLGPSEILFVADAMIGQQAVSVVKDFDAKLGITGIIMTKTDSDARCGAIISMKHVTGKEIKFLGGGEKMSELYQFYPDRVASRILGMGDIVSLVESAIDEIGQDEAKKLAKKLAKGKITMNDLLNQIENIRKMGSISAILDMIPGLKNLKNKLGVEIDDNNVRRQIAMIKSMTEREREDPDIICQSRRARIASGAGTSVDSVNLLMKNFNNLRKTMKKMKDPRAMKEMFERLTAQ